MNSRIISEDYADLIIENNSRLFIEYSDTAIPINFRHSIINVPVESVSMCGLGEYLFGNFPFCYTLESITSLEKSGVAQIQENTNFALYGNGVLIGIIDSGIDYQHGAFLNADNTTKIASLWDQTINTDGQSSNVLYGREYSREDINEALRSENPLDLVPSKDDVGHGTMISGLIVGNESVDNNFRGVVPSAELIVVKLKEAKRITRKIFSVPEDAICYQATDILLAITYVINKAKELSRPISLCLALGSSQGGHDGRGALSWYLSYLNEIIGTSIAISGGNEGNMRRHYQGITNSQTFSDNFELNVGANETGFTLEIWQRAPNLLSISFTTPSGEFVNPIFPTRNECRRISPIFERTIIYVNNIISEANSGDQLIILRFENPTQGIWRFTVNSTYNQVSSFDAWLPSGNLISPDTYFLNPSPEITLTAPAYSLSAIAITAYNHINDSIWINSSRGYSSLGIIKPDLVAPGVNLTCPIINNRYGSVTGTGAAAAHTAGITAMFLEWGIVRGNFPGLRGSEIRNILIRGAKRDSEITYPNNIWGYGMIDVFGAFDALR